ncbi:MAG: hypothetical protein IT428_32505 [Planctomycetaceae bacterium]|nr:hypothetical protein [Planctomycetaceae bacterium]
MSLTLQRQPTETTAAIEAGDGNTLDVTLRELSTEDDLAAESAAERIRRSIVSWSGVADDAGEPVEYSAAALADVLRQSPAVGVRLANLTAYSSIVGDDEAQQLKAQVRDWLRISERAFDDDELPPIPPELRILGRLIELRRLADVTGLQVESLLQMPARFVKRLCIASDARLAYLEYVARRDAGTTGQPH